MVIRWVDCKGSVGSFEEWRGVSKISLGHFRKWQIFVGCIAETQSIGTHVAKSSRWGVVMVNRYQELTLSCSQFDV
jgi:hypothetical protein